jgi:methyl-accepting chemotaxis protein
MIQIKKLTLGKKIALGFGTCLILTSGLFFLSYQSVKKLKTNGDQLEILRFIEFNGLLSRYDQLEVQLIKNPSEKYQNYQTKSGVTANVFQTLEWYFSSMGNNSALEQDSLYKYAMMNERLFHFLLTRELNQADLQKSMSSYIDSITQLNITQNAKESLLKISLYSNLYHGLGYKEDMEKWQAELSTLAFQANGSSQLAAIHEQLESHFSEYLQTEEQIMSTKIESKAAVEKIWLAGFSQINVFNVGRQKLVQVITNLIMVFSILIILTSAALLVYFTRNISRGAQTSMNLLHSVEEGNLSLQLDESTLKRTDEFGTITQSIKRMAEKWSAIIRQLQENVVILSFSSKQLTGNSKEISESASNQATSLEEASSSMEEMAALIEENTRKADNASKTAKEAWLGISRVQEASRESLEAINDITSRVTIINDIAFQTNLLALNAAIEAARAGQAGRGFSVVAAEVKKLADRSREAADEIIKISSRTIRKSEESGKLLSEIIPIIQKTAERMEEIAQSGIHQNTGSQQINNSLQELNQNTQGYASSAEELSAEASQLKDLAENLKKQVSYFSL